jgi:hypothetical protein
MAGQRNANPGARRFGCALGGFGKKVSIPGLDLPSFAEQVFTRRNFECDDF